ncbi:unnamed protein product [Adineta steineri]|uniref:Cation efflux protein cytoplasmic domain-containing protein n=2 Tax=Adineta steineri TaxID=433720 RepID=A0A814H9R1_9BILA|nr:unnamed protein product [Adineta steineri]CAF1007809.1 unnamed protein product [Adineta steineri]CAF3696791.1 unnamed protein product [Adineta steineri]CAF3817943.1 unnamed protein product [Adineta steineri]
MSQTNVAYKRDSDAISLGDLPSDKQYTLSPAALSGRIRSISNQIAHGLHRSSLNVLPVEIDNNHPYDNSYEQQVPNNEEKKGTPFNDDDDSYYSLKNFRERRRGKRDEDSGLSRRIKRFYKDQDELIDVYEQVHNRGNGDDSANIAHTRTQKISNILTKVSLAANITLFILKIAGAVISTSLSVISSVIDSAVDLASSIILFWAWYKIKRRDKYRYPQGRTRLEPIGIIVLAVIMCAASVLVIYESINTIVDDANFFKAGPNTTKTLQAIDMSAFPIAAIVITAVVKGILFALCVRVNTPTMSALAADHINDTVSNIIALVCGIVGSYAYKNKINQKAIFIDPIGAICISVYIIITWIKQMGDQTKRLSGHTADPRFISQITWLTYHHSPLIEKIDTVRAFYFGTSYLVEVDIVLPEDMLLKQAHDIGEGLQKKIEDLPEVERAFVHLDYEFDHHPADEHKVV